MSTEIDHALTDKRLLGAALEPLQSWSTWLVGLRGAFDRPLDDAELEVFHTIAGDRSPPEHRVRELWAVCGRRSGKSRMAAAIAIYLALFVKHARLARGEKGMALVIAGTVEQARTVLNYITGFIEASSALRREVVAIKRFEVELRNGITIAVHPNSFRSVRGRTLVACIFDETAFWRDESTATPDTEVYTAVLPSLATTDGMLVGISTPYRKTGLLHSKWRDHFGVDSDDVLVVQGASRVLTQRCPTLSSRRSARPIRLRPVRNGTRNSATIFLPSSTINRSTPQSITAGRSNCRRVKVSCISVSSTCPAGGTICRRSRSCTLRVRATSVVMSPT
jgi:hypothetical protein